MVQDSSKAFMSSGNDTIAFPLDKDASDNIVECFYHYILLGVKKSNKSQD